jgi:DNA ligase-4
MFSEEGIVLKDRNSTYVLDHRSPFWLKFKPSYSDSLIDTCDLLLVGTKFGSGRRGGKLASIVCAVRDDRIPDTEPPR